MDLSVSSGDRLIRVHPYTAQQRAGGSRYSKAHVTSQQADCTDVSSGLHTKKTDSTAH